MKTDMSAYGVAKLTPQESVRDFGRMVLAVCGSSGLNDGLSGRYSPICGRWVSYT